MIVAKHPAFYRLVKQKWYHLVFDWFKKFYEKELCVDHLHPIGSVTYSIYLTPEGKTKAVCGPLGVRRSFK